MCLGLTFDVSTNSCITPTNISPRIFIHLPMLSVVSSIAEEISLRSVTGGSSISSKPGEYEVLSTDNKTSSTHRPDSGWHPFRRSLQSHRNAQSGPQRSPGHGSLHLEIKTVITYSTRAKCGAQASGALIRLARSINRFRTRYLCNSVTNRARGSQRKWPRQ